MVATIATHLQRGKQAPGFPAKRQNRVRGNRVPWQRFVFTCCDSNIGAKKIMVRDRPGLDAPEEIVNTIFMSAGEAEA
jgi:hypothetical protein